MFNIAPDRLTKVPVHDYLWRGAQVKLLHDSKSLLDAHIHTHTHTNWHTDTATCAHTKIHTDTDTWAHRHTVLIGVSLLLTLATTVWLKGHRAKWAWLRIKPKTSPFAAEVDRRGDSIVWRWPIYIWWFLRLCWSWVLNQDHGLDNDGNNWNDRHARGWTIRPSETAETDGKLD